MLASGDVADVSVVPRVSCASLRDWLKRVLPQPALFLVAQLRRLIVRTTYTSADHWHARALRATGSKVLWGNSAYNRLFRDIQAHFLQPYVERLPADARVLDVGCGVGDVSRLVLSMHSSLTIDAIDLPLMIAAARQECPLPRIHYIAAKAEEYFDSSQSYDLVISSGCFTMIPEVPKLEAAIGNALRMTAPGGLVIMMEPFHTWRYLARANYGCSQAIRLVSTAGFELIARTGALFWPYQPWLSRGDVSASAVEKRFAQGERLLHRLGPSNWADYQFLAFRRIRP